MPPGDADDDALAKSESTTRAGDPLLSFDFRQLFYFCSVVEYRSFSNASQELHVAQPWLSAQVRKLETRIGHTLFERSSPLRLTPAGDVLYIRASRFLREARSVVATLQSLEERAPLPVVPAELDALRVEITLYALQLPRNASGLDRLTVIATECEVRTDMSVNHTATVDRVRRGLTDLALCLGPVPAKDLHRIPVHSEEVHLVLGEDDPLTAKAVVSFRDLAGRRISGPVRGHHPWMHDHVYRPLRMAGAEVVEMHDRTLAENFRSVRSGTLALCPTSGIPLLPPGLVTRSLGPSPLHIETWWIMSNEARSRHASRLWAMLEAYRIESRWLRDAPSPDTVASGR